MRAEPPANYDLEDLQQKRPPGRSTSQYNHTGQLSYHDCNELEDHRDPMVRAEIAARCTAVRPIFHLNYRGRGKPAAFDHPHRDEHLALVAHTGRASVFTSKSAGG